MKVKVERVVQVKKVKVPPPTSRLGRVKRSLRKRGPVGTAKRGVRVVGRRVKRALRR